MNECESGECVHACGEHEHVMNVVNMPDLPTLLPLKLGMTRPKISNLGANEESSRPDMPIHLAFK